MASEDHRKLANIIKNVHQNLRLETHKIGVEDAWEKHCSQEDVLKTYAGAMKKLASEFWNRNAADLLNERAQCRVQWVAEHCNYYYFHGGSYEALEQEIKLCAKYGLTQSECSQIYHPKDKRTDKLRVLDVGSCYNPFENIPTFDVLPIDIAPASQDVFQCDFLNVIVSEKLLTSDQKVTALPVSSFDVVVFSLLLEYFPSPKQRFNCCEKAFLLLKPGGILCIVTPDSKHATANAKIIKMWRYALASIGFLKLVYEKLPHLHCMVYRKCINPDISLQWLTIASSLIPKKGQIDRQSPEELIVIPQDSHTFDETCTEKESISYYTRDDDDTVASIFKDLPQI